MPNALAAAALPVTATKCELTSTPLPSAAASQALALAALASVSCVVNDLRRDDEHRRRRIERRQRAREVLGIDVGHERDVHALRLRAGAAARARRRRQRRADEQRAEIGAADAEIDDGADGPSRGADAQAAADLRRQRAHPRLRRADVGDDVAAVHHERRVARLPQRRVQRRPALGLVDLLAGEERRDPAGEPGRRRVGDEQRQRVRAEPLLRQVDEPAVPGERQASEPVGVAREELGERRAGERAAVVGEIVRGGGGHRCGAEQAVGPRQASRQARHRILQHRRTGAHCKTARTEASTWPSTASARHVAGRPAGRAVRAAGIAGLDLDQIRIIRIRIDVGRRLRHNRRHRLSDSGVRHESRPSPAFRRRWRALAPGRRCRDGARGRGARPQSLLGAPLPDRRSAVRQLHQGDRHQDQPDRGRRRAAARADQERRRDEPRRHPDDRRRRPAVVGAAAGPVPAGQVGHARRPDPGVDARPGRQLVRLLEPRPRHRLQQGGGQAGRRSDLRIARRPEATRARSARARAAIRTTCRWSRR